MPSQHAVLSPSSAERWLSCPASVRVAAALPKPPESSFAHEGTMAHALGEVEASRAFGLTSDAEYLRARKVWVKEARATGLTSEQVADMEHHIADYVEFIRERLEREPMSTLALEQRLDTGVPTCWGTSDAVISSPTHVEIIDLKYGAGVPVSAAGNPQLRLYALGAVDTFGDVLGRTETVYVTVFQPRLNSTSTEAIPAEELRQWREGVIPVAEAALGEGAEFGPSESACRWCPAAGQCRAQMEWATARDFATPPDLLSLAEMGEALTALPSIKAWVSALEAAALDATFTRGEVIPGYKVVMSGGTRTITDPEAAVEALVEAGLPRESLLTTPAIKGLGALETELKALPKVQPEGASRPRFVKLEDIIPSLIGRTPGRPALAPESDPRPLADANAAAAREFEA